MPGSQRKSSRNQTAGTVPLDQMEKSAQPPVWLWPNVLALDAPLIALVWQDFLARCYPGALDVSERAVLGLTVWCIYLADRLLDLRNPRASAETPRHLFSRQHQTLTRSLLAVALFADLVIASFFLQAPVVRYGLFMAAGVCVYLATFSLTGVAAMVWKKATAACFFTAGIFLVSWTTHAEPVRILGLPAVALSAVLMTNLLSVEIWEMDKTFAQGWLPMAGMVAAGVALHESHWLRAVTLSAACLGALNLSGRRIPAAARCLLADAALLSPLLF